MTMRGKRAYIREVLRDYPKICAKLPEKRTRNEQRRVEIVESVLDIVDRMPHAASRRAAIDMVYFRSSHTISGAAFQIPASERTVSSWNKQLMELMDKQMDLP